VISDKQPSVDLKRMSVNVTENGLFWPICNEENTHAHLLEDDVPADVNKHAKRNNGNTISNGLNH
jgi:hypothetical protein